ncbi:hypothetical protein KP79_PYT17265 [Mizuhopecten yessoensis]|uniref:Uncharacterized protein n=1 Tax=Mizuhopecten yessoensis TaxID=6573 RepID=A0A210PPG9_MIZYE|nr:hypothetical protein KP79_PYT17265 [Mizuhopecten yessoensis]
MQIPDVYKRVLIDQIINLQSPDTKNALKRHRSPFNATISTNPKAESLRPKQLKYDSASSSVCNADDEVATITLNPPAKKTDMEKCTTPPLVKSAGYVYLENEL